MNMVEPKHLGSCQAKFNDSLPKPDPSILSHSELFSQTLIGAPKLFFCTNCHASGFGRFQAKNADHSAAAADDDVDDDDDDCDDDDDIVKQIEN